MSQAPDTPRTNHPLHAVATVLTLGLWSPFWVGSAARSAGAKAQSNIANYAQNRTALVDRGRPATFWEKFWALDPKHGAAMLGALENRRATREDPANRAYYARRHRAIRCVALLAVVVPVVLIVGLLVIGAVLSVIA